MNAETPSAVELNVPQAFLLLATNDQDGRPELPMYALRTTLAGAILAELDLIGAIELQGKHVRATGSAPQTELQHELELIRHKSRPHSPKRWVSMLEGRAEMERVYEGMVSKGIIEHAGEKHLGVFRTVRYPEKDHAPEAALVKKIQAALDGEPSTPASPDSTVPGSTVPDSTFPGAAAAQTDVSTAAVPEAGAPAAAGTPAPGKPGVKVSEARTMALIALLEASGLLAKLFPGADASRANELAKDYWPARAVEDELLMVRLAQAEAATL